MNDNIWYYSGIFVVVYLVIQKTELDIRTIISLIVSMGCVYILYLYSNKNNRADKRVNKKYENINGDFGLLDLLGEIKFMKKVNRRVYNDILGHLENFLKLKSDMGLDINRKNNFESKHFFKWGKTFFGSFVSDKISKSSSFDKKKNRGKKILFLFK